MTDRVEACCDNGHPVEIRFGMDFETDMDVAERFPVPGICPTCGAPLSLQRWHYEPVEVCSSGSALSR